MIERVTFTLNVDTGNEAIVTNPIGALADMFEEQLVDRLRAGCDYGTLRDANGNSVGSWNIWLDGDNEET